MIFNLKKLRAKTHMEIFHAASENVWQEHYVQGNIPHILGA